VPSDYVMKKVGSVGPAVLGVELKIHSPVGDKYGEVLAKGDNVMLGYMDDPEATEECMTEDGFYRTGDIGYLDKDGFLYITGRKKNVIVLSSGKNVYPEEIEEYLNQSDLIKECVVTARQKTSGGEKGEIMLCALIYPDFEKFSAEGSPELNMDEVYRKINEEVLAISKKLPLYKQINIIEIRETEFKRNASKKIVRHNLE
jgi:long-chain acyl-CoA synthetase